MIRKDVVLQQEPFWKERRFVWGIQCPPEEQPGEGFVTFSDKAVFEAAFDAAVLAEIIPEGDITTALFLIEMGGFVALNQELLEQYELYAQLAQGFPAYGSWK